MRISQTNFSSVAEPQKFKNNIDMEIFGLFLDGRP